MKTIFIAHGQGIMAEITEILDKENIRGFTRWEDVQGRGSKTGEPRFGTHTWPALNNALLAVVEDEKISPLLEKLKALDKKMPMQGLKAFVWQVEEMI